MFFPVAGDPDYSSVSLLLPMTGTNGSTTFTDVSPTPKTVTRYNAVISTTQHKWGSGSGYFDGTGDYLTIPDSSDFDFGSGNFTLECWIYINGTQTENKIFYDHRSDDGTTNRCLTGYYNYTADTLTFDYSADGTTAVTTSFVGTPAKSEWLHVAFVRSSNTGSLYINGTASATTINFTGVTLYNSTETVKIGGRGVGARSWNGYLQDLRVTKGVARYTADFAPPTGLLPKRTVESPPHRKVVQLPSHIAIAQLGL